MTSRKTSVRKKLKLVLDGQQRLQSLYIALFGSYEGRSLYFDVLSGRDSDDLADEKYDFAFLDIGGFEQWRQQMAAGVSGQRRSGQRNTAIPRENF